MYDWLALSLSRLQSAERHRTLAQPLPTFQEVTTQALSLRKADIAFMTPPTAPQPFRMRVLGDTWSKWQPCYVILMRDGTLLVCQRGGEGHGFRATPDQLAWFGRPEKYHYGENALLLHAQIDHYWYTVQVNLTYHYVTRFIRSYKAFATPQQVTAYRRRAHLHYGPVSLPGDQTLYITPLQLVISWGLEVQRIVPLHNVSQVAAEDGLLTFAIGDETFCFALPDAPAAAQVLMHAVSPQP
ncbi:MAG: hypothetical protein OHK0046_44830 [Anaerolineae bacterium]